MSEKDFTKQREKWERWLKERQSANNLDEPLLIFVDDEPFQRDMRYYEMRLQKHPGRNILLFENANETIEFIKFAGEKNLHLGAVVSDFDNRPVSDTRGSEVLMAAAEYGNKIYSSFVFQLDRLKERISSNYNENDKASALAVIERLIPTDAKNNKLPGNRNLLESLKAKYGDQPDIFGVFLAEAKNNLDKNHPFQRENQQKLVKLLISSTRRPISSEHEHNKPLAEFNATAEAKRQGEILSFEKNNSGIEKALLGVKPKYAEIENQELIPDLIFSMRIVDTMLHKFNREFAQYEHKTLPLENPALDEALPTVGEMYAPAINCIKDCKSRIENMLKLWALIKDYELRQEQISQGEIHSNNPNADQPADPVNVKILGEFFLEEFKQIQKNFGNYGADLLSFSHVAEVLRAENKHLEENARERIVDTVTHNLKGPMLSITGQIRSMTKHVEEYLKNPPPPPMSEDEVDVFRFTPQHLFKMIIEYMTVKKEDKPKFRYTSVRSTGRTREMPGDFAPQRETLTIPQNEHEAKDKGLIYADDMPEDFLGRFLNKISIYMDVIKPVPIITSAAHEGSDIPSNSSGMANLLNAPRGLNLPRP